MVLYKILNKMIMRLWIARDESVVPDDMVHFVERHPEKEIDFARLHIFYDKPIWTGNSWKFAREMCEVKNYMFPEIGIGECIEFKSVLEKEE